MKTLPKCVVAKLMVVGTVLSAVLTATPAMAASDVALRCEAGEISTVLPASQGPHPKDIHVAVSYSQCTEPIDFRLENADGESIDTEEIDQALGLVELAPLSDLNPGTYTLHFEEGGIALRAPMTFEIIDEVTSPINQAPTFTVSFLNVHDDDENGTGLLNGNITITMDEPNVQRMQLAVTNAINSTPETVLWLETTQDFFLAEEVPVGEDICIEVRAIDQAGNIGPEAVRCITPQTSIGISEEGCSTSGSPHTPPHKLPLLLLTFGALIALKRRT